MIGKVNRLFSFSSNFAKLAVEPIGTNIYFYLLQNLCELTSPLSTCTIGKTQKRRELTEYKSEISGPQTAVTERHRSCHRLLPSSCYTIYFACSHTVAGLEYFHHRVEPSVDEQPQATHHFTITPSPLFP